MSSFVTYVFKKLSAAEASESVYMRERVKTSRHGKYLRIELSGNQCGKGFKAKGIKKILFPTVLSAIANINRSIDTGSTDGIFGSLSEDHACIANLDEENAVRYQSELEKAKNGKQGVKFEKNIKSDLASIT